jgi:hypothetical protein
MPKNTACLLAAAFILMGCNANIGQSSDLIRQKNTPAKMGVDGKLQTDASIFNRHLASLKNYAASNGYSNKYCFLVDMAIHSGAKRFFVVDLKIGKVLTSGLVTHGSSTVQMKNGERKYSNENSSFCTSLGKYKVGQKYFGKFGLAYKLTGLDATNSNAYARAVVLHSHPAIPDDENTGPICQSWGCPTVSPNFLNVLAGYINASNKPILLDIFDSGK